MSGNPEVSARRSGGFTLIELVIIVIILGIMAAVAIPKYLDMRKDAADSAAKGVLGALRGANNILWSNRILNSQSTTYTFPDLMSSIGVTGLTWVMDGGGTSMTVTISSGGYLMTMDNYASPPTTYPTIYGPYSTW